MGLVRVLIVGNGTLRIPILEEVPKVNLGDYTVLFETKVAVAQLIPLLLRHALRQSMPKGGMSIRNDGIMITRTVGLSDTLI